MLALKLPVSFRRIAVILVSLLCSASLSTAAEPTISWDTGSPANAPGPRIQASGSYSIPEQQGNVSWSLVRIEIEYQRGGASGWITESATVDQVTKTWSFITVTPLPSGVYYDQAKLVTQKVTSNPPPLPPTGQNITYYAGPVQVILPEHNQVFD